MPGTQDDSIKRFSGGLLVIGLYTDPALPGKALKAQNLGAEMEAAAGLLEATGNLLQASKDGSVVGKDIGTVMRDYFETFNEYYAASRGSRLPQQLPSMQRLLALR